MKKAIAFHNRNGRIRPSYRRNQVPVMKKVLLCINPKAGVGKSKSKLFDIVRFLNDRGCEVTVYTISPEYRPVEEILKMHQDGFDVYACCGGDGTLNRFINAYKAAGLRQPIGYYPLGSTNDFAKTIWKHPDIASISRSIAEGEIFSYDLGRFNAQLFNYIAAFGAFTDISYSTEQKFKNAIGYMAYVVNGIANLPQNLSRNIALHYKTADMEHSGNYIFGAISNTTSIGGFSLPMSHCAELNDGLFEVLLVKAPANVYELGEIVASLSLGTINADNPYIELFQTDRIRFEFSEPVHWTLDGEDGGAVEQAEIRVEKQAMKLMV